MSIGPIFSSGPHVWSSNSSSGWNSPFAAADAGSASASVAPTSSARLSVAAVRLTGPRVIGPASLGRPPEVIDQRERQLGGVRERVDERGCDAEPGIVDGNREDDDHHGDRTKHHPESNH